MVALPNLPDDERVVDDKDARIRLLICNDCNTIQPLPWYEGPAEQDATLIARLGEHRTPAGTPHRGALTTVSEVSWNDPNRRRTILEEMARTRASDGDVGLGDRMYSLRSTFEEDAMTCWRHEHNRTQNCEDYKSDRKRLVQNDPDTRSLRREVGAETRAKHIPANAWLCDYCPYKSIVMQRVRKSQGFY